MQFLGPNTIVFAALFLAGGFFFVLGAVAFERRRARPGQSGTSSLELPCPTCSKPLVVHRNDLTPLSSPEIALMVSAHGRQLGNKLGSMRCPYCESEHTFALDDKKPKWVASDTFEPHRAGTYCVNCRSPLLRPNWPAGSLDGQIRGHAAIQPKHGLVCSRCNAICCVECVQKVTRNRTADGSYLCPRCFRGPVEKVHHW